MTSEKGRHVHEVSVALQEPLNSASKVLVAVNCERCLSREAEIRRLEGLLKRSKAHGAECPGCSAREDELRRVRLAARPALDILKALHIFGNDELRETTARLEAALAEGGEKP